MGYVEFAPSADLAPVVECTWERRVAVDAVSAQNRVLPDGRVDLVWRRGEIWVAGPDTAANLTPLAPGEAVAGIRFAPGYAGAVLGVPLLELGDSRDELEGVWGAPAAELRERLGLAAGLSDARAVLEGAVRRRLGALDLGDGVVPAAVRRLGGPGSRVGTLSRDLGISERQLRRRFDAAVGYGPKTLDRVLRFRRFASRVPAVASGDEPLARLAAELGYADQAHLSRDCVLLSGLPPARLARIRSQGPLENAPPVAVAGGS